MTHIQPNRDDFFHKVQQLSRASVDKHFDAYADIDWDAAENAIDPRDPRFALPEDSALGAHDWYRAQPERVRAEIGLHMIVRQMKVGIDFENILSRGLLERASTLPNQSAEFRYLHHEVIEEGQHQLMFQEFVNRTGLEARGLGPIKTFMARRVPRLGRSFPELFFVHVLGGEEPIDYVQRETLRNASSLHPLLGRILRIHVTEEARHVHFAKSYLAHHVPRLPIWRLWRLRLATPLVLASMTREMLEPPRETLLRYGVPRLVAREAFRESQAQKDRIQGALRGLRDLCVRVGIVTPEIVPLWRRLGLWREAPAGLLEAGS